MCVDERSLGFWALGYGRASGTPAAVIVSSGTAVANLLPAVVEASLSAVPMLLLTADRPGELRDTGGWRRSGVWTEMYLWLYKRLAFLTMPC